jgi:hypothetical protein
VGTGAFGATSYRCQFRHRKRKPRAGLSRRKFVRATAAALALGVLVWNAALAQTPGPQSHARDFRQIFHPEWLRIVRPDPGDRFCRSVALSAAERPRPSVFWATVCTRCKPVPGSNFAAFAKLRAWLGFAPSREPALLNGDKSRK